MKLRLAGMDFDKIAAQVGYSSRASAWKAYGRAMKRRAVPVSKSDNVRENEVNLELARLDELQKAVWPKALRGDLSALDRVLKIGDRRERLLHRYHTAQLGAPAAGPATTGDGVLVKPDVLDNLREKRRAGNNA